MMSWTGYLNILFIADVKQEILKLMLKKGSLSSLISNSHQNFKTDLIQRLEQYGYNKTKELDSLKVKADTSKLAFDTYCLSDSDQLMYISVTT